MSRQILERKTFVTASPSEVFAFFSDPANLARLTPEAMRFRILSAPARPLQEGDKVEYSIRVFGVPLHWSTRITSLREGEFFEDRQERGPYRYWLHTHSFRYAGGETEMHDRVVYELPFGWIGQGIGGWLVSWELNRIFSYRARAIRRIFRTRDAA